CAQGPFACEGCRRPAPMALSAGLGKRPQDGSGSAVTTDLRLTIGAKKKEEPSFWTGFLDFAAARRGSRSTGIDPRDAVADEVITVSVAEVHHLALGTLLKAGVAAETAAAMADVVTAAETDECASHGLYRIIGCVDAIRSAKVDAQAVPRIRSQRGAIVRL